MSILDTHNDVLYVFFNGVSGNIVDFDKNGVDDICCLDLVQRDDVNVLPVQLHKFPRIVRWLNAFHHSRRINKVLKLPLKKLWYPLYYDLSFIPSDKDLCFIFLNVFPLGYMDYLRKRFPRAKFVKIHRDLISKFHVWYPEYTEEVLDRYFDLRLTYNPSDAAEYGIGEFSQYESKLSTLICKPSLAHDVFFVGKAKDRLSFLLEAYDRLESLGQDCFFYLTEVAPEKRSQRKGIYYADQQMPFLEALNYVFNSKCLLDISQHGSSGLTLRCLEAIMYDKRLITNVRSIEKNKYYDASNMLIIDRADEINEEFFFRHTEVSYGYEGDFSPLRLIEQIEAILFSDRHE